MLFLILWLLLWMSMASMAFGGTTQKCKACEKTVYWVDELTADNRVYHKACFRCHHCKGTLKFSNYSSIEGVLYCKPHYDQLYKMTGSLDKSFEGTPRSAKVDRSTNNESPTSSRVSSMFVGTQEKCVACKKTVYPIEKVAIDGNAYHRPCFKCTYGGCVISPSNCATHEGKLYCKHHHNQLFMSKGDFSQLEHKTNGLKAPSVENGQKLRSEPSEENGQNVSSEESGADSVTDNGVQEESG